MSETSVIDICTNSRSDCSVAVSTAPRPVELDPSGRTDAHIVVGEDFGRSDVGMPILELLSFLRLAGLSGAPVIRRRISSPSSDQDNEQERARGPRR